MGYRLRICSRDSNRFFTRSSLFINNLRQIYHDTNMKKILKYQQGFLIAPWNSYSLCVHKGYVSVGNMYELEGGGMLNIWILNCGLFTL